VLKKLVSLTLIVLMLFGAASCTRLSQTTNLSNNNSGADVSWAYGFNSIEEMANDTRVDLIAVGEIASIIGVSENKIAENDKGTVYMYFTDYNFKINRVLKGTEMDEVVIHQTGADGQEESIIAQDPLFRPGEKYVLFLHEYEPGKTFVAGGPDGRFRVVGDNVYSMHYFLSDKVYPLNNGINNVDGTKLDEFINSVIEKIN
jgi:hypothetical protein